MNIATLIAIGVYWPGKPDVAPSTPEAPFGESFLAAAASRACAESKAFAKEGSLDGIYSGEFRPNPKAALPANVMDFKLMVNCYAKY